ncbi:hypothetical protein [Archangium sp.]|uniref:hypothetical protein n=1 Tax=Archangium sp. TaxID=1872627 RepID=UPI00286C12B1|nr:hypothetical protein [Archangium sp.]
MLRKTVLLSTLLLSACGDGLSSPPHIVSIEPQEVMHGEAAKLAIKLDAPLPVKIDYGRKTATLLSPPTLRIGGQDVVIDGLNEEDGTLLATLPTGLSEGTQDVRLVLGDGHEAVGTEGLTVLPRPPLLEAGNVDSGNGAENPKPLVTNVRIEPIADQVLGVPFDISLRAEGPEAARFEGRVQITTSKGRVSPNVSSPFVDGLGKERIVLDKPGNTVLTVRLGDTIIVRSNAFKVSPH